MRPARRGSASSSRSMNAGADRTATRERLREAALELFADRGFDAVTVRDLARHARVNLAAVSYHFGDKLGLYRELIDGAIRAMRTVQEQQREATRDDPPEAQLRKYIVAFLTHMAGPQSPQVDRLQRLIRQEATTPSQLGRRVIEQGMLPRLEYCSEIVAKLLDCPVDDARVRMCVISIQAQCGFFARGGARSFLPREWQIVGEAQIAAAAAHVADFSLAGIRAMKRAAKEKARP
jgi:TetR/AcrR family transcriptional regulator, regulator of cefoperazone and chloramphenicol sensitivity